jgi:hypothetical protein
MVRPRVSLKDKAELKLAREIMEGVEAQCFISNSIKSKISLAAEFVVSPSASRKMRAPPLGMNVFSCSPLAIRS